MRLIPNSLGINNRLLALSLAGSVHKEITRAEQDGGEVTVLLSVQMTRDVLQHIIALLRANGD